MYMSAVRIRFLRTVHAHGAHLVLAGLGPLLVEQEGEEHGGHPDVPATAMTLQLGVGTAALVALSQCWPPHQTFVNDKATTIDKRKTITEGSAGGACAATARC